MKTKKRIYCFPYAGGSSFAFRNLSKYLSYMSDVIVLDYPGHGIRFGEKFAENMEELTKEIANQVFIDMDQSSSEACIFLGHSMGALVAYETAKIIENTIKIDKLILCGSLPPNFEKYNYNLNNKDEVFNKIFMLGGIPSEIRDEPELYNIFSEIIYHDIKILNTFHLEKEDNIINIPLSIYYGEDDSYCDRINMREWVNKTNKNCTIHSMPGDHFFLFTYPKLFCKKLIESENLFEQVRENIE